VTQDMNKEDYPPVPDDWEEEDEPETWQREDIWDDRDPPWVVEADYLARILEEEAGALSDNREGKEHS
jgi:hypothetical protein